MDKRERRTFAEEFKRDPVRISEITDVDLRRLKARAMIASMSGAGDRIETQW